MNGQIHTFYSYKGGVGRTLCLANVATLLARWGWNVLCVDMDLEAPGLAKYLAPLLGRKDVGGGVVDWLADIREGRNTSSWKDWVISAEDSSLLGRLALLPAGNSADHSYLAKVQALDWTALYKERNMGQLLEDFKTGIRNEYDLILIDSRTGVSDSGGICTIQLPDAITFFFTPNEQSLYGAANTMRHVQTARLKSVTEPGPALMLPVLTRFEQEKEYQKANEWRIRILDEIGDFYLSWLPRPRRLEPSDGDSPETGISPEIRDTISSYLDQATVPQVAFWSFGEPLPVLQETNPRKDMISFTYENIAALIANGFSGADELLRERRSYLAKARKRERSDGPRVFLSYSGEHREIGSKLAAALKQAGLSTWFDSAIIPSGANLADALEVEIRQSDALVVIDSGTGSRIVDSEIASFIRTREGDGNHLNIIPVRLDDKMSNPLLQGFPSLDGHEALLDEGLIASLARKISETIRRTNKPQAIKRTNMSQPAGRTITMNASDLVEIILTKAPAITIDGQLYYIVENDHKVPANQLLDYAQSVVNPSSGGPRAHEDFSELVSATVDGRKMRWKAPTVLTWAMDEASFNGNEERLAKALVICSQAAEDWNEAARQKNIVERIQFEQVDEGCAPVFLFAFYPFDAEAGLLALAFFPNAPVNERVVYIGPLALDSFVGYDQVGIIRHELGHVLGFRHEHIRKEATKGMTAEEMDLAEQWVTGGIGGEAITKYDGQSVMHYPIDPAKGIGTLDFELSEIDKEGFHALYSAPYDPATIREFTI